MPIEFVKTLSAGCSSAPEISTTVECNNRDVREVRKALGPSDKATSAIPNCESLEQALQIAGIRSVGHEAYLYGYPACTSHRSVTQNVTQIFWGPSRSSPTL